MCPQCHALLTRDERVWRCENNHSFDVSKTGAVNLLLPQHKRSLAPGDSKEMVSARRDFLASGHYQPIAESLARYVMMLSGGMPVTIADAGCGEGFYLRQIKRLCFPQANSPTQYIGWDISKFAVQSASKQADFGTWLTATNAKIPLSNQSVDILLSLFGFEVADEFFRVLKNGAGQGGYVVALDAGENHLIEIRRLIYPEIKPYREKNDLDSELFQCIKKESLCYQTTLQQNQLVQLMKMTPHFFRAKPERSEQVFALSQLTVTVDVLFRVYRVVSHKSI